MKAVPMKPINVAIFSLTHGHTRKYFQTLKTNASLNWVAVSAETPEIKAHFESQGFGVPCYLDQNEMLDRHPDIDAAVLASSNDKHFEQMRLCAERKVDILSMKIPTFDLEEYDKMIELVDRAGIICQIELELHYNPVMHRIKQVVASGELGPLVSIQGTNTTLTPVWAFPWQGVPEKSYGQRRPLRQGDSRFCGGALCDHPHIFDLARWLTGSDFECLFAQVGPNLRPDVIEEDMLVINGRMKNGVSFLIDPSWSRMEERLAIPGPGWEVFPKRMEVDLVVSGEKGCMAADCFGPNVYHNGAPNDRYTVQYTYFDEWIGMMDEFTDCIRTRKQPAINLRWHRRTIEVMNACYDSIACDDVVALPG
jgi:predicted dehydrogenase